MFKNLLNLLMVFIIIFFSFNVFKNYTSINNIKKINLKRDNIEITLREKIENLPILSNNTEGTIEFNSGFEDEIKDSEPRSFWQLLKFK